MTQKSRKLITLLALSLFLVTPCFSQTFDVTNAPLQFQEQDLSPSTYPYRVVLPNSSLTDTATGSIISFYNAVVDQFLKLDQTTPQDISNGQPDFLAGLRAGSTNQFSIDSSGNVLTSGTLGAGAITGTSFIIGANTLTTSEWAYLDGQDQAIKTSSSPTFNNLTLGGGAAVPKILTSYNGDLTIGGTGGTFNHYLTFSFDHAASVVDVIHDLDPSILTIDWDATTHRAYSFYADIATGTQPYRCESTTLNTNLNADLWDGYQFSDYLNQAVLTTSSPSFVDATLSGILNLPTTTSTVGIIKQNSLPILHTYGTDNLFMGRSAGNFTLTGSYNLSAGALTLDALTSGSNNVGIGYNALSAVTTTSSNTAVGYYALNKNTSSFCTALGTNALANSTGISNAAFGNSSLGSNTTGLSNVAVGSASLYANKVGNYNAGIAENAGRGNITGSNNTYFGFESGYRDVSSVIYTPPDLSSSATIGARVNVLASNTIIFGIAGDKIGLGHSLPIFNLGMDGEAARTWGVEREQTDNTAGNTLTIAGGGANVSGAVQTVAVNAGGTGYTVGDWLTITGGGANARVRVTTIGADPFAVTAVQLQIPGTGYSTSTGTATTVSPALGQRGTASGCTIDVSAITATTDKAGGDLILQGGTSTGSAESGVQIKGCVAGASGTTDRTFSTMIQVLGNKTGFYGVTPVVRQTYTAVSNPPTQAEVTAIRDALINLGLMAAS